MAKDTPSIEVQIENCIYLIRGNKVMLDRDLARLYQVTTKSLVQAVKRNSKRFPEDFMFRLSDQEYEDLRSQIVTSTGQTGRRYSPYVFTEQGIAMLSGVLRRDRAIQGDLRRHQRNYGSC
ncbi:MAG: ORF6N domain-containing protein [Bdellovibrionales bacterium]|nr:ORF6N domain-containing protein [Bdellovibrionales bacterium]